MGAKQDANNQSVEDKIADVKERLTLQEGRGTGAESARHSSLENWGMVFGVAGVVAVIAAVVTAVATALMSQTPDPLAWRYAHGYQFSQLCYSVLNKNMTDIEIMFEQ